MGSFNFNLGRFCWIFVERMREPGREAYELKPRAVTESYFDLLENGVLQHVLFVADWDTITPEALWVGNKPMAEKIVQALSEQLQIRCQIRALPESMIDLKTGMLNFQESNIMEQLIKSAGREPSTAQLPEGHPESKNIPSGIKQKFSKDRIVPLGKLIFDKELARKLVLGSKNLSKDLSISYINIYYYREEDNPPLYDNIVEYPTCLVRFTPKFPQGWRYMCSLDTYAKLLRAKFVHVIEKGWSIPFSEEALNDILEDKYLFYDLVLEVAGAIIWEGEVFGNMMAMDQTP